MSISFTAMQNALLANGMYEITEDTRLYAELKAYDAGFQTLHDQLDELLQEALIPTAVSYGLEEKELLFGLHLSSCTEEERRKLLCMRGAVNVNSFSKADFLNILQSGGISNDLELTIFYYEHFSWDWSGNGCFFCFHGKRSE